MLRLLPGITALLILAGCRGGDEAATNADATTPAATASGAGEGVRPYTPASGAVGGPVQGTESVEGAGGGGIGQAAKDRARSAAGTASGAAGMDPGMNAGGATTAE